MFRVVHPGPAAQDTPHFWLVCDDLHCGVHTRGVFDLANPAKSHADLIAECVKLGWIIGLDGQFCPPHSDAIRMHIAEARARAKAAMEASGNTGSKDNALVVIPPVVAGVGNEMLDKVLLNRRMR